MMAQGELKRKPELCFFLPPLILTDPSSCLFVYTLDQKTARAHLTRMPAARSLSFTLLTSMIYNQFFHLICWGLEAMDNLDMQTTSTKLGNYLCTRSESSLLHTSIWYVTNRLRDWVSKYNVCEFLKCKSMNYYKYIFSKSTWLKK